VTGQPFANAKSALEGAGFVVTRADVASDQPQGVVVQEDPPQGTPEPTGTTVTVSVSKGPAAEQIPDVTGETLSTAEQTLTSSQLTPAIVYVPVTDPSQDGIVQTEDPAGGAPAKVGETVTLEVGQLQNGTPGGDSGTTTTTATTTTPSTTTTP
jgi:serine/threonine-protein kinase